jgi:hypothetical protein
MSQRPICGAGKAEIPVATGSGHQRQAQGFIISCWLEFYGGYPAEAYRSVWWLALLSWRSLPFSGSPFAVPPRSPQRVPPVAIIGFPDARLAILCYRRTVCAQRADSIRRFRGPPYFLSPSRQPSRRPSAGRHRPSYAVASERDWELAIAGVALELTMDSDVNCPVRLARAGTCRG